MKVHTLRRAGLQEGMGSQAANHKGATGNRQAGTGTHRQAQASTGRQRNRQADTGGAGSAGRLLVSANDWRRQGLWRQGICIPAYFPASTEWLYSLRGSNPRPMAHKTIALTTELRELLMKHSAHRPHDHTRPEPSTTAVLEDSFWPGQLVLPTSHICWGKLNGTRPRAGLMAFPPCYRSHFSFR